MIFGRKHVRPVDHHRVPREGHQRTANNAHHHRIQTRRVIDRYHNTHVPEREHLERHARRVGSLEFAHQDIAHDSKIDASTEEALAFGTIAVGGLALAYLLYNK